MKKHTLSIIICLLINLSCSPIKYFKIGVIEISMEKVDYKVTKLDYEVFSVAIRTYFNEKDTIIKILTTIDSSVNYKEHGIISIEFSDMPKNISEELTYEHLIINKKRYPINLDKLIGHSSLPIDTTRAIIENSVAYVGFSKPVYDDSGNYVYFVFERQFGPLNGEGLLLIMKMDQKEWKIIYTKQVSVS